MAIGKISGVMLKDNLERQGVNLSFDGNLVYLDVTTRRLGVGTSSPQHGLDVPANVRLANLTILGNTITSNTGRIGLGSVSNVVITGGGANYTLVTDGTGNLSWSDVIGNIQANIDSILGNTIELGSNATPALISNAVVLTTSTTVTDAISQLNFVLGKLVPPAPPTFPGTSTLTLSTGVSTGRITNFVQTDNSGWGNLSVASGTSVSATRVSTYTAGTITTVGPGDSGTVTAYRNGVAAGTVTMATGSQNGTYSNLVIASDQDYAAITGAAGGFWESFNASLSGSSVPAGWNRANIRHSSGGTTNTITWYYDSSTPGTPTFSNLSIALTSNSSSYSSTVPHFNTSTSFRIKGNVARLSGDTYPVGVTSGAITMVSTTAGGAFATPSVVTYTGAGVTVPLERNLYVSSGSAYFETTVAITTGFGSSASGPSLSVNNNYATGPSGAVIVSGTPTVLYKTGTGTQIEETSMTIAGSVGSGSGAPYRIINPGTTDTPTYLASAAAFNSTTSTLTANCATVVASVLKHDITNYSTGYLPVGPNLSTGRHGAQYYTFKFIRTAVSKFDIKYTGTMAGLWVALPGSTIDSTSTLNGWLTMGTAYAGSGVPGANTGAGGNGSNGCALGGLALFNSAQTNKSVTATFGTVSSSSTATNEIYVRVKLTSGQTLTALTIEAATN
jgi:hypothetical protein